MKLLKKTRALILILLIMVLATAGLYSKEKQFLIISPENVSRYNEDRIAYQRIEKTVDPLVDNSVECLMVIKKNKIHFIVDGYEAKTDVMNKRILLESEWQYIEDNDFWLNKINGKPDYVRVIYRRSDMMVNANEEFVTNNFGTFYKTVRDSFIRMHVDKYRNLLSNRGESGLVVTRKLLLAYKNPEKPSEIKQKFSTVAKAKALDETLYTCEDADGDGVTETFMVSRGDGFDWGIGSGPNMIFIYKNTDKDIETMIGKLAHEGYHGTVNEEKKMIQTFPKEKEIIDMIDLITPFDKYYED